MLVMILLYMEEKNLIKYLMNKLEFVWQENKPSLNLLSCLIMSLILAQVQNKTKMNKFELLKLGSSQLVYNPN